jgi:hypothetical protein
MKNLDIPFDHVAPEKYFYSFEEYKSGVIRIWLNCTRKFDYNNGKPTRSVWGFYSSKKRKYFSPINSITIGKEVRYEDTRNYTAMQIHQTILEKCFV